MKAFSPFALILLLGSLTVAQVKITTTSLPEGTVRKPYSATIETKGGQMPFKWSSVGLPAGLKLTPSRNTRSATLTGNPTRRSTHQFDISVEGRGGHMSTVDYTLTIQGGGGKSHHVGLTWQAGAQDIVGYNIYRSTTSGTGYSPLNSSPLSTNSFTDSHVDNGNTYYYVTTEVNNEGQESGYSAQVAAVIP